MFSQYSHFTSIRQVNKHFRSVDESNKWPINGRFNATERAIRNVRKHMKEGGQLSPVEYALALRTEISYIVNDPANW